MSCPPGKCRAPYRRGNAVGLPQCVVCARKMQPSFRAATGEEGNGEVQQ